MIVVGVDGGGTKTKAIAVECVNGAGKIIAEHETEGSNFHNVGIRKATQRIREAIMESTRGARPDLVVMGLAGLDSKYDYEVLWENLHGLGKEVIMDNDSFFLLYSETRGGKGVITISGTGSVILGIDGNKKVRAEGAGWFLSDTGSAYWVGREALRYLTKVLQGVEKETEMTKALTKSLRIRDVDDLIYWVYHKGHRVERVASVSKIVDKASRKGDSVASSILSRAASELGEIASRVAREVGSSSVYVVGGMFRSKTYAKEFEKALLKWRIKTVKIDKDPTMGPLMYGLDRINCKLSES
ncbi:hypothetical protein L3N51_00554 [Metallosphaera sp. J1]|uniref:BadF/BadG/BcrA/BcrD ATPase family protein n=1 Tax=Metallosphaera javensis (ex Hofmann et al. 2022) TaxID=99938 RepID=UPI001EE135DC|nr:BadF/BadG/BcrA/BcrD ATPase family protein [Metallosphaera javensis (ex Hofmann et al. 2022)]MCG3108273.1 hypothetical protein [Metallosphaera javensis (ex Hofmann et al. 2022)]